jgi:N-carbamoylputrescine amidase
MNVTVCQFHDDRALLTSDWNGLLGHVKSAHSDLVLLPELPFSGWFMNDDHLDPATWQAAVEEHDRLMPKLHDLSGKIVLSTRPVNSGGRRLNTGFAWDSDGGFRAAHDKHYLPNETDFWEASWYDQGDKTFAPLDCGEARVGFMICSELWFMEHARAYGQQGVNLLAAPRATMHASLEKWLLAGRVAAIVSGAFCCSSNRFGQGESGVLFGGQGWIIDPDGAVLALTSESEPFVTVDIDLQAAAAARETYPRNVKD